MRMFDYLSLIAIISIFVYIAFTSPACSQDYTSDYNPVYSTTFPSSGVYSSGENIGVYTNGESVTNFGGVIFLGERKSCVKVGSGFICN